MLLAHPPSDMQAAAVALAGLRTRLTNTTLASTLSGHGFCVFVDFIFLHISFASISALIKRFVFTPGINIHQKITVK